MLDDIDKLQVSTVFTLWQPSSQCDTCLVLLLATEAQQKAGRTHCVKSASAALNRLSPRCRDVTELFLQQTHGAWGISQLGLIGRRSSSNGAFQLKTLDLCFLKAPLLQLPYLILSGNPLGYEGIEVLVSAHLPNLRELGLCETQLDADAAKHLINGKWPMLEFLSLHGNLLDDVAMLHIADGKWPELETSLLRGNPFGALRLERLTKGRWPKLDTLRVDPTVLSPAVLTLLDVHIWPCLPTEKHVVIKILRNFASHDPGQFLIWPRLCEIVCMTVCSVCVQTHLLNASWYKHLQTIVHCWR